MTKRREPPTREAFPDRIYILRDHRDAFIGEWEVYLHADSDYGAGWQVAEYQLVDAEKVSAAGRLSRAFVERMEWFFDMWGKSGSR